MFNKSIFKLFSVVAMLMMTTTAWATSHGTHYGKFVATTTTGDGKVYVSLSEGEPDWTSEELSTDATWNCDKDANNDSKTGHFYAKPDDGSVFAGWYEVTTEGATFKSADKHYTSTLRAVSQDESNPTTYTLHACFFQKSLASDVELAGSEHLYLYTESYPGMYVYKGADYGTRAILVDNAISLLISQDPETKLVKVGTDESNFLFVTTDGYVFTDSGDRTNVNFIFNGDNENGYKIILPNDVTKAIGVVEASNQQDKNDKTVYYALMPVDVDQAPLWKIGQLDKVTAKVNATAKYGTFCAPFDVTLPTGVKAFTCDELDGPSLSMTELDDGVVPANTAVVLNAESGMAETDFYGIANQSGETVTTGLLTGVYVATQAPMGSLVLQNHEGVIGFYTVDNVQPTVPANRCYLNETAAGARFVGFGGETAIQSLQTETTVEGRKYVDGKNIFIVKNGKKFNVAGQRVK